MKILLRVVAPHFVAGATWVKRPGSDTWRCDARLTAPILRWMAGSNPEIVEEWISRNNYKYQWMRINE